jgi:hypothetical protein
MKKDDLSRLPDQVLLHIATEGEHTEAMKEKAIKCLLDKGLISENESGQLSYEQIEVTILKYLVYCIERESTEDTRVKLLEKGLNEKSVDHLLEKFNIWLRDTKRKTRIRVGIDMAIRSLLILMASIFLAWYFSLILVFIPLQFYVKTKVPIANFDQEIVFKVLK